MEKSKWTIINKPFHCKHHVRYQNKQQGERFHSVFRLTPGADGEFEYVTMDYDLATRVQLKAKVEGVRSKPCESGQHEVVH